MTLKVALAGAGLALSLSAVSASAHLIVYTLDGVGAGTVTEGANTSDFSGVSFEVQVFGDTSISGPCGSGCAYVYFDAATISADNQMATIDVNPAKVPLFVIEPAPADPGIQVGIFAQDPGGSFSILNYFVTAGLAGYEGVTSVGPVGISWVELPSLSLTNGDDVNFSSITGATFSADVPEPASWAMMILGIGGLGASLRARRRMALAS